MHPIPLPDPVEQNTVITSLRLVAANNIRLAERELINGESKLRERISKLKLQEGAQTLHEDLLRLRRIRATLREQLNALLEEIREEMGDKQGSHHALSVLH